MTALAWGYMKGKTQHTSNVFSLLCCCALSIFSVSGTGHVWCMLSPHFAPNSLVHRQGNLCPCMLYMQSGQNVLSYLPKYIFSMLGSFCIQKSCLLSDCRVDKHEWNLRLLLKLGSRLQFTSWKWEYLNYTASVYLSVIQSISQSVMNDAQRQMVSILLLHIIMIILFP